jgi:hypothetical protein
MKRALICTASAVAKPLRAPIDAALGVVEEALGREAFAEAFAAGRQLTLEEAFAAIPTAVYASRKQAKTPTVAFLSIYFDD